MFLARKAPALESAQEEELPQPETAQAVAKETGEEAEAAWPGNVRELRNVVERAMILENKEFLEAEDLPAAIREQAAKGAFEQADAGPAELELPDEECGLRQMEERMVRRALQKTNGNQSRAAQLLDISRDSLRYKMRKLGIPFRGRSGNR